MFTDFTTFFRALWDCDPFPWQTMLAESVTERQWPGAIDLPTAAGKTACLDIAVYALAAQSEKPLTERTTARRIWFVVDRRVVVDEAFERAERLASRLADENAPAAIRAVAERLLQIRGLDSQKRPLAVGRLRGGVLRDDRWARIPSQASIITSTVDQLGSRLLLRSYGDSPLAAPVYAGLAGNDSLILLDEAHCAVPFLQTLRAVQLFRSSKWAAVENPTPFHITILSATPRSEGEEKPLEVFPAKAERERALNHPKLQDRLNASKERDLFFHLIASHHGHARPFAPVCEDADPPSLTGRLNGLDVHLSAEDRKGLTPPHRLDSGVSDRFWALTRRFGWWGLAYREAVLRLADWYASAHARNMDRQA